MTTSRLVSSLQASIPGDPDQLRSMAGQFMCASLWANDRANELEIASVSIRATATEYDWSDRAGGVLDEQAALMRQIGSSSAGVAATLNRLSNRIESIRENVVLAGPASPSLSLPSAEALAARSTASSEVDSQRLGYVPPEIDYGLLLDIGLTIGSFFIPAGPIIRGGAFVVSGAVKVLRLTEIGELGIRATETYKAIEASRILKPIYSQAISGAPTIWIAKYLGVNGRGYLAENVVFDTMLRTNSKLVRLSWPQKVVDLWDPTTKTISSIKSIDPRLASYADNPAKFKAVLQGYVDDLHNWANPVLSLGDESIRVAGATRELIIVVPSGGLKAEHLKALEDLYTKASNYDNNRVLIKLVETN